MADLNEIFRVRTSATLKAAAERLARAKNITLSAFINMVVSKAVKEEESDNAS